jgi:hypothetical protein
VAYPAGVNEGDADLRDLLSGLPPKARDTLRRVLFHDQADRDAAAFQLLRYRDVRGDDWADIIDYSTSHLQPRGKRYGCSVRSKATERRWEGGPGRRRERATRRARFAATLLFYVSVIVTV